MRRRIASNLLWMLSERGLQIIIGIAGVAILARSLGPEGFARFQYAQAIVVIASSAALICGAEIIVPRLVSMSSPVEKHKLLMHAGLLRLCGAVLGYLLICLFLLIKQPSFDSFATALLLGIPILCREPSGVVSAWMQSATHNRPGSVINLCALSVRLALIGALYVAGVKVVPAFATAFAIEASMAAVLLLQYYRRHIGLPLPRFDATLLRELFQSGALLWGSFVLMMLTRRIDQLILETSVATASYGAYAACMQIMENFSLLATVIISGLAPAMVYAKPYLADARRNVTLLTICMGGLGLCGAIGISLMAEWIVHVLYGRAFAATADMLRYAAFAASLIFVDVALSSLLAYMRRPYWFAAKWIVVLVVTVLVDLVLIPRYGALGAIVSYAITNATAVTCSATLWYMSGRPKVSVERAMQ